MKLNPAKKTVKAGAEFDSLFYNLIWKHVEKIWKKGNNEKPPNG